MNTPNPLQVNGTFSSTTATAQDYQVLLESFAQTYWEADANGKIVTSSPARQTSTGQPQELIDDWTAAIHPDDRNRALQQWQQAVAQGLPLDADLRLRRPDSSWHWMNIRATPIRHSDGSVKKWLGITIDISQKKQGKETLQKSERFLQGLIRSLPLAIYIFDLVQRRNRYLSPQVAVLFGYTPEQMQTENLDLIATFFHPDDRPRLDAHFERIRSNVPGIDGRSSVFQIEYRARHHQRGWVWVESRDMVYARDAEGKPTLLLGTAEDITERRANAQALRESEKRLRLAIEATELGTWEWNLETNDVYWNEQHFRLFGMTPQAQPLTPDAFMNHVHPTDRERISHLLQKAIAERSIYDAEFCARLEDGSTRWMSGYGRIVEEQNGKPLRMSGVMYDVDERRRAQDVLRTADQRKDEFLAMLAHELRNPMSTLRSGLQILTITAGKDETSSATIAMMNRQTDHLVRLVDDLLDVSRISQGKIELKTQRVNLVKLVAQAAQAVQALYEEQGRRVHVELPTTPIEIEGDVARLSQVVTNLLTNGARYTEESGQVWLSLLHQGQEALIQVRDNGIGLAADQLVTIFELFVQVDTSLARSKGGLGLGLTLVKRLVELHRGRVEAQSEGVGEGSTFRVYLPTLTTAPEPTLMPAESRSAEVVADRILLVDDNVDATQTLSMLLKLKGYEVYSRHSGQAGLEAVKELKPGVVLLDIGMPGMDGYETARAIRQQPWGRNVILIALTGYGGEEDKQRANEAGFDGHLVKPVDLTALSALMANLLSAG